MKGCLSQERLSWNRVTRRCSAKFFCGSPILRIGEPLGTQSPKTKPFQFLSENLENFSQFFFFFLANLDLASNSMRPPPPPTWEFWILANLNSASNSARPPPQPTWEFWILANLNSASNSASPTPPSTWEFWILANLNSASNSTSAPPQKKLVNARTTLRPRPGAPRFNYSSALVANSCDIFMPRALKSC